MRRHYFERNRRFLAAVSLLGIATWFVLSAAAPRGALAGDRAPAKESPQRAAVELAKAADKIEVLAKHFDANKDQVLSADEQAALVKFVAEKFGRAWADRLEPFLHAADTNRNHSIEAGEWKRAIQGLGPSQAKGPDKKTFMVAMSDGIQLATDVYLPDGPGPFPVIFTRTPYDRRKAAGMAPALVRGGYALVAQDMRGRFESGGENLPFIGCGWAGHQDGAESISWLRKQSWANGKICTVGGSAAGITQNLLAGASPEGLTAQYITVAAASMYHDATYVGGALRKCQVENWQSTNRFDPRAGELMRAHPAYDEYWQGFDTRLKFGVMNTPAVHVGGWFDTFAQGSIDSFVGRQHHGADGAKGTQKLVMGPWTHAIGKNQDDAELIFPNATMPAQFETGRWLEYYLKGVDNGVMREPAVVYYVMGDTRDPQAPGNQWRTADDWPVASRQMPYYFQQGGSLLTDQPSTTNAAVEYTFDPANPCPTLGGNNLTIARGPRNQNAIESPQDVVLFTTDTLTEPLEVTGRVTAKVFVASSAVDSDLSIRLCDVYPDGKSYNIADGILRLRYRKSLVKPEPLVPGEIAEVEVDCWSTSIVFNRGHRVRVAVTSSNFPRFDINPGTSQPWVDGEPSVKQTNRIFCDAGHASCIVLPVVVPGTESK